MNSSVTPSLEPLATLKLPLGVGAMSRMVEGTDSADMQAVWLYFPLDDRKAQPAAVGDFVRDVERAASDLYPGAVVHVRFEPGRVSGGSTAKRAKGVVAR